MSERIHTARNGMIPAAANRASVLFEPRDGLLPQFITEHRYAR
jgi:hypothetical protein